MDQHAFHLSRMQSFLRARLAENDYRHGHSFRPALTISRQSGAGTENITRTLIEYLSEVDETAIHGWALFDQSLIAQVIEHHRLPKTVGPFDASLAKFSGLECLESSLNSGGSARTLFHHSANTIRSLCHMGNVIVLGRGSNFVCSDLPNTFHVRLVSSWEKRRERTQTQHLLSADEADNFLRKADRSQAQFVEKHTGSDSTSPTAYHLTLNTDNISNLSLVRILADSLLEWANEQAVDLARKMSKLNAAS